MIDWLLEVSEQIKSVDPATAPNLKCLLLFRDELKKRNLHFLIKNLGKMSIDLSEDAFEDPGMIQKIVSNFCDGVEKINKVVQKEFDHTKEADQIMADMFCDMSLKSN